MATARPTIIDFVEKYSRQYENNVYLREKVNGQWKEITQGQTREEAYRIGAGLMSLGVKKGDKIALLSESRAMWILSELGAIEQVVVAGGLPQTEKVGGIGFPQAL